MITVLLASFQGQEFIREQLDSILNQTVPDIKIVVSDDCSTDGTAKILEEYQDIYGDRIRVLENSRPSGGAAANFFRLLSQAEGDRILLSDQDDVWLPHKVETLLEKMKEMELEYGEDLPLLVHSDMKVVNRKLEVLHQSFFAYQHVKPENTGLNRLLVENNVTGGAVMMNRPLLRYFRQPPNQCFMHDWWIALTAACFGKTGWVNQSLSLYRQHGDNVLGAKKPDGLKGYVERFKRKQQVEENYRKMFAQAACFLEQYSSELMEEQKEILRAFASIPKYGRMGKIRIIVQYGFFKSTCLNTVGQCFSI